ncbi:hypothetical protein BGZ63DRAFT_396127 [Mariannaea sp. PMI_226]|nr:hypothetical protein BGZ63DRAFT_396127 [Mariannaea sp. PMI_226]
MCLRTQASGFIGLFAWFVFSCMHESPTRGGRAVLQTIQTPLEPPPTVPASRFQMLGDRWTRSSLRLSFFSCRLAGQ